MKACPACERNSTIGAAVTTSTPVGDRFGISHERVDQRALAALVLAGDDHRRARLRLAARSGSELVCDLVTAVAREEVDGLLQPPLGLGE